MPPPFAVENNKIRTWLGVTVSCDGSGTNCSKSWSDGTEVREEDFTHFTQDEEGAGEFCFRTKRGDPPPPAMVHVNDQPCQSLGRKRSPALCQVPCGHGE